MSYMINTARQRFIKETSKKLQESTKSDEHRQSNPSSDAAEIIGSAPLRVATKSAEKTAKVISSYNLYKRVSAAQAKKFARKVQGNAGTSLVGVQAESKAICRTARMAPPQRALPAGQCRSARTGEALDLRRSKAVTPAPISQKGKISEKANRSTHISRVNGRKNSQKAQKRIRKNQSKIKAAKGTAKKTMAAKKAKDMTKKAKRSVRIVKKVLKLLLSGGIVVMVFIVVFGGMIAVLSSATGIFAGTQPEKIGENSVRQVVMDLNREYSEEITQIKDSVQYDTIQTSNIAIDWKQVLSIYAVQTAEEGNGVVAMDKRREARLHELFWEMNGLDWNIIEEVPEESPTEPPTKPDRPRPQKPGEPKPVFPFSRKSAAVSPSVPSAPPETKPPNKITLVIVGAHKTAADMFESYDFTDEQKEMAMMLISPENDRYWKDLIYGSTLLPNQDGWVQPLENMVIGSPYGYRVHPISGEWRLHAGVDLDAATGTPIMAAKAGRVVVTLYEKDGAGNYVLLDHGDGITTIYMHMLNYVVAPGQTVKAGEIIGYVGSTGLSTGPHLHFGVSINGEYIDPMQIFADKSEQQPAGTDQQP